MGLARIVCGIGRFTNTSNEGLVLNAGLLGALVGAIGHAPRVRAGWCPNAGSSAAHG